VIILKYDRLKNLREWEGKKVISKIKVRRIENG